MGGGGPEVGVCDSLSHASASVGDSHHSGLVLSPFRRGDGFGGGDSGSSPQGSVGACASDSRLLQPHVCHHQGVGRVETDHRPLYPEPVCGSDSFSDGDCPDGSSLCEKERLDGLRRSEGCVPSDPDPPCQPQISQVHSLGEDLAVSSPLLWAVHGAAGLHSHVIFWARF